MPPRRTKQDLIEDEVDDEIIDEEDEDEDEDNNSESAVTYEPSESLQEYHWQRRTISELVGTFHPPPLFFLLVHQDVKN